MTKSWPYRRLYSKLPQPIRKIIGDLSDQNKVLVGLNLLETEGVE